MNEIHSIDKPSRRLWVTRCCWAIIGMLGLCTPLVVVGVYSVRSSTADMTQWLPDGRPAVNQYKQFVTQFGVDDFVLITWDDCHVDDERIPKLANALREARGNPERWRAVTTGPEALDELTDDPPGLSVPLATSRLQGLLLGTDRSTTCIVLTLTSHGTDDPHAVLETIRDVAHQSCGFHDNQLRLAGSVYKAAMIDYESDQVLAQCVAPSCAIALIVTFLLLRSIRQTFVVLVTASFCGTLSIAIVHFSSGSMNAVLVVLPTLIFVLTVSGAVHLANYYRDALRDGAGEHAAIDALKAGIVPCTLATISTSIGMASLLISDLQPVRDFGFYSALSLLVSLGILFACFVAILTLWPQRAHSTKSDGGLMNVLLDAASNLIVRHHCLCMIACLILLGFTAYGLRYIRGSVDLFRTFRPENELIQNYTWIEENVGSLAAIEVVVHFSNDCEWPLIRRIEQLNQIRRVVHEHEDLGPSLSALSFAPPIPKPGGVRQTIRRTTYEQQFDINREKVRDSGWLTSDGTGESWRIHVRLSEIAGPDYDTVIQDLNEQIQPLFAEDEENITVSYTGGCPLIDESQSELLNDLTQSFLLAFAILCPITMIVLRGFWVGLITMVPNVAPVVIVFGLLGWLGVPVEIGTMLTASVALGIAVDDSLHFLTWYRRAIEQGETRVAAIKVAYRRCAVAMIQTTLICSGGMIFLVTASFVPASQFAVLMMALLMLALLADLVLLPALLASPLGAIFFRPRTSST